MKYKVIGFIPRYPPDNPAPPDGPGPLFGTDPLVSTASLGGVPMTDSHADPHDDPHAGPHTPGAQPLPIIPVEHARARIFGYAAGIDLTRRDLQAEAKQLRRPWYIAKSFIGAAPISPIQPASAQPSFR
jgi:hypothetical protein